MVRTLRCGRRNGRSILPRSKNPEILLSFSSFGHGCLCLQLPSFLLHLVSAPAASSFPTYRALKVALLLSARSTLSMPFLPFRLYLGLFMCGLWWPRVRRDAVQWCGGVGCPGCAARRVEGEERERKKHHWPMAGRLDLVDTRTRPTTTHRHSNDRLRSARDKQRRGDTHAGVVKAGRVNLGMQEASATPSLA